MINKINDSLVVEQGQTMFLGLDGLPTGNRDVVQLLPFRRIRNVPTHAFKIIQQWIYGFVPKK